ncbi:MAG: RHS repeat-associated core domain-containing protein [Acidobacteriota bacterium]
MGAGWRLSLGQLYSPDVKTDLPFNDTRYWVYVGPDASEHKFFPTLHDGDPEDPGDTLSTQKILYSRDGSYLRLTINLDGTHTLEFPDGQIHTFNSSRQLITIRDRFAPGGIPSNFLAVAYTPTTWTLSDSRGRTQTLTFSELTQDTLKIQRLEKVEMTAFPIPGQPQPPTATWTFQYSMAVIPRACPDCNDLQSDDPLTPPTLTVYFLTGITQPDGGVWSMPLSDYVTVNPSGFNDLVGRIKGLTLPTLGRLEWDYGYYRFPSSSTERRPWAQSSRGVVVRRKKTASGNVEGAWTYSPHLMNEGTPSESLSQELVVTVTTPLGDKTENYFSVFVSGGIPGVFPSILDYGRPFTPKTPDGQGRFLSSRVFDCQPNGTGCVPVRSTWVRYEQDASPAVGLDATGAGDLLDPRVAQTRTAFEDDCPPGSTGCDVITPVPPPTSFYYSDEDFSSFDGLGHYRTRNLRGNFPDITSITETTSYNMARGIYGTAGFSMLPSSDPWLLGLYQDVTRSNNSGENSTVESCFNPSTGFLRRKRVRKFGRTTDDVLVVYTPTGVGTGDGTVAREDWSGGDGGHIPIAELCGLTPPGATYSLQHTYQQRLLAKSEYLKSDNPLTLFEFAAVDRAIDPRTGLVASESDIAQLPATYEYDTLGRLTWVQPAQGHGAWTEYSYARATSPSSLAKVTINQHANGAKGNTVLTTSSLFFDSFGRLIKEQRKMPGAGNFSNRETTYDAIGNRATVSEWEAGVPSNRTQYLDYDPFGRPRTIQPSDGAVHAVTVTRRGVRVVTKRSKAWGPCGTGGALQECSSETVESYDQIGRLFRIDQPVAWPTTTNPDPAPLRTSYAYDIGDRLKTVKQFDAATQAIIQQRDFSYDNRGFLTSEKHPELGGAGNGLVTYSGYDARGHAHQKFDGVSNLTFEYDRAERMTRVRETGTFIGCGTTTQPRCLKEYTFGTANSGSDLRLGKVQVAKRYNYPKLGTTTHTVAVAETYVYAGKDGRASKRDTQTFFNTAPTEAFTQGFTYDDLGNTASLAYPQCTHAGCAPGAANPKTVAFAYTEGLLTAVPGYASSITYNSNQTISQVVHVNGITDVIGLDPNAQQRPASILAKVTTTSANLWNAGTYLYDGAGNVKSIGGSGFAYDPASRLTTANLWDGTGSTGTPLKTQTYSYDLFGNLQAIGGLGGRNTPTSSATNRLNGAGMAYDAAGNQTANIGAVHEYDPFHLMWHFQSGAEDWRYVYTAEDERIWSFKTGGTSRWTLRDLGNNVLREYTNNGGAWSVTEDFIHRGGQLLAADTTAGVSHFHLDHLGTPRLVTNQSGVKTAYHVYWPYGEELTSATQDAERMKFTGHERDLNGSAGTGDDLDYMHARFCSPVTGRFSTTDPSPRSIRMSMPQSWNRYSYVMGNPYKYVDPGGDQWFKIEGKWTFIPDTSVIESVTAKSKGKEESKSEVVQGREQLVGFDGGQLTFYRKDGSQQSFDAVSGRGGRTNPKLQSVSGVGPIPEGRYSFNTANVQSFSGLSAFQKAAAYLKRGTWPGGTIAWGDQRVELNADSSTNTYGRGGFFIHGGFTPGSAGCIDLCDRDRDFFSAVGGSGEVTVEVDYP